MNITILFLMLAALAGVYLGLITKSSTATLRPDLTDAIVEYDIESAARKFIGRNILPIFRSATKTGEFAVFNRENVLRVPDTKRAPGTGYNRQTAEIDSKTFACEEHGLEFPLDDSQATQYSRYYDFLAAYARILWLQLLLGHERRVAAILASITGGGNVTTAWATIATATPITDIDTAADAIGDASGVDKSDLSLVVSRTDFRYLRDNASILDRIKYTNPGVSKENITAAILRDLFGIREILVPTGSYNTVPQGEAITLTQIWPAGIAYLIKRADSEASPLVEPCVGRTVIWTEDAPAFPVTETYRDDKVRSDVLRERLQCDEILQQATTDTLFAFKLDTAP